MTTTIQQPTHEGTPADGDAVEAFAERIFGSVISTLEVWSMYLGDKLGLYEALASGAQTRRDLVEATGVHPRYADEWLEHQVTSGILDVDDHTQEAEQRVYSMSAAVREVMTDPDSLAFLAPFVRLVSSAGIQLPGIVDAFQTGGGVSWVDFGDDMRTGQADMNRPWFLNEIGGSWFPSVPDLHERLESGGTVADVGCGEGWSSIAIARAYPGVRVEGFDIDAASVEAARRHADEFGVADRVTFVHVDGGELNGEYDVVTAFECVHDMPHPVEVLAAMRRLAGDDGIVVVMDEAVGDHFGQRDDEVERLMYGLSLFVCLPDGMSHEGSVGTGTVMRPGRLEAYAAEAGFGSVEVLPIENDLWRFYRLR